MFIINGLHQLCRKLEASLLLIFITDKKWELFENIDQLKKKLTFVLSLKLYFVTHTRYRLTYTRYRLYRYQRY